MSTALRVVPFLALGFVLGRLSVGESSSAEAGAKVGDEGRGAVAACAGENGDVNADGELNITDAIELLGNLFLGDPESLVPLCPVPAETVGLPDTGQTRCYDAGGRVIACANAEPPGQDAAYRTGCPPERRFTENGDGTVSDACTGLMWEEVTDTNGDGSLDGFDAISWSDALAYCEDLERGGHSDWRLPNITELLSLVDYGGRSPAFDSVFDPGVTRTLQLRYWTATTQFDDFFGGLPFTVDFDVGGAMPFLGRDALVRAVRTER